MIQVATTLFVLSAVVPNIRLTVQPTTLTQKSPPTLAAAAAPSTLRRAPPARLQVLAEDYSFDGDDGDQHEYGQLTTLTARAARDAMLAPGDSVEADVQALLADWQEAQAIADDGTRDHSSLSSRVASVSVDQM